jgi:hypothetical protein
MPILDAELKNVQNSALGATLVWRFACGYQDGKGSKEPTPLPLLFVVLPIMFHEETSQFIKSTYKSSGLRAFAGKFSESRVSRSDLILSIQARALEMRDLSLDSIRMAVATSILSVQRETGGAFPLSITAPKTGIPKSIRQMMANSEKLGFWCGQVSMHEISIVLKVGF